MYIHGDSIVLCICIETTDTLGGGRHSHSPNSHGAMFSNYTCSTSNDCFHENTTNSLPVLIHHRVTPSHVHSSSANTRNTFRRKKTPSFSTSNRRVHTPSCPILPRAFRLTQPLTTPRFSLGTPSQHHRREVRVPRRSCSGRQDSPSFKSMAASKSLMRDIQLMRVHLLELRLQRLELRPLSGAPAFRPPVDDRRRRKAVGPPTLDSLIPVLV